MTGLNGYAIILIKAAFLRPPEDIMNTITIKSDKPIVAIALEEYESMKETIELLSANPCLAGELKKERDRMNKGHFVALSDFKKKYGVK